MPKPRRAMTPFSFRRALVIFSGFVVCTLSLLALCSNHGSPLSPANLLIEAKLAMRKYGGNNLRSLTGIQNRAPAALVVQQKDLALAKRSAGRTSETGEDGKGSESSKSGTETLLTKRNSSNGLSLMRRGANTISETGSAGAKTVTYSRSAEPVTLTRIPSKYSKAHLSPRYLYWGPEIDHPNAICSGFNHQAVSLVCALTEALATGRTFILPSHICIRGRHRGLLQLEKATRGESFSAEATKMQEGGSKSLERKKDKSDDVREGERSERQSVNEAVGASSHSWAELESLIDVGCVNRLVPIVLNTSLEFHGLLKPWESQGGTSVGRCFNLFSRELGLAENMRKTDPIDESLPQLKTLSKEASNESGLPDSDIRRTLGVRDGKNDTSGTVCVIHGRVKSADMAPWNASKLLVRTRPKGIHFPWFKVCKQGSYKKGIW